MPRANHVSGQGNNSLSAGNHHYFPFGTGWADGLSYGSTENDLKQIVRLGGTWRNLSCYYATNSFNATTYLRARINGSDGNQAVSVGSSTTGQFTDSSHSDSISAGDYATSHVDLSGAGSGSGIFTCYSSDYEASSNTCTQLQLVSVTGPAAGSLTYYYALAGRWQGANATEANGKTLVGTAGTLKNGYARIAFNSRGNTTHYISRINGSDGTIDISVASSSTGDFEDTSHSDTIASGDALSMKMTTGSGSGTILNPNIGFEFETTNSKYVTIFSNASSGFGITAGTSRYLCLGGAAAWNSTEARSQSLLAFNADYTYLNCYISGNTGNGTTSLYLRDDGGNTSLTVAIGAATTGQFSDTTHTASVASGSLLGYFCTDAGNNGGIITFRNIAVTGEDKTVTGHTCGLPLGSLTFTGKVPSATLTQNVRSSIPLSSLTFSAKTPGATLAPLSSQVPLATLTLTGNVPQATKTEHVRSSLPLASLTLTANAPQLTLEPLSCQIPAASLTLTANTPQSTVIANDSCQLDAASLTVTPNAPAFTQTQNIVSQAPAASLTLSAQTPSATHTQHIVCQLPAGSLTLSTQTPSLTLAPLSCELPTASLSLTANAPGAIKTENFSSQLPAASLTLTANNPGATTTEHISSAIPSASLTLTPNAPQNTVPNNQYASIPAASLTLSPQVPAFSLPDSSSSIPLVTLTLTANAPGATVTEHIYCAIPSAALTLAAQTPQLTLEPLTCSLPSFSLTLTPQTPQATTAGTDSVSLPVSTLTLTANAPQAAVTQNVCSSLPSVTLSLLANAPSITTTDIEEINCELPAVSFTLSAQTPQATVSNNLFSIVPLVSLTISAKTPSATTTQSQFSSMDLAGLIATTNAPTFTNTSNTEVGFPTKYNEYALYHYAQAGIRTFP